MNCEYIGDCTSTSGNNLPSVKSPRQNITEKSNTPAQNTPKETIIEPKHDVNGSGNNSSLRKGKSSIDMIYSFFL